MPALPTLSSRDQIDFEFNLQPTNIETLTNEPIVKKDITTMVDATVQTVSEMITTIASTIDEKVTESKIAETASEFQITTMANKFARNFNNSIIEMNSDNNTVMSPLDNNDIMREITKENTTLTNNILNTIVDSVNTTFSSTNKHDSDYKAGVASYPWLIIIGVILEILITVIIALIIVYKRYHSGNLSDVSSTPASYLSWLVLLAGKIGGYVREQFLNLYDVSSKSASSIFLPVWSALKVGFHSWSSGVVATMVQYLHQKFG